jgi:hypothetical protein
LLAGLSKAALRWYIPLAPNGFCPGRLLRKPLDRIDRRACVGPFRFGIGFRRRKQRFIAGWSSPVARQAHNLKVIGSNPIPATRQQALESGFRFQGLFAARIWRHEHGLRHKSRRKLFSARRPE